MKYVIRVAMLFLSLQLASCAMERGPMPATVAAPRDTSWFLPQDNRVIGQQSYNFNAVMSQAQPEFVAPSAY